MKAKLRIAVASVLVAAGLAVTAGAASYDGSADRLKDLGLFQGTQNGYELDRAPTRGEAAAMLVRLLGKEAEAKELTYDAPFTDLAEWQKPYVQYLYTNGLTNGATATTFAPADTCSAQMYTTFLLRSLGYSDAAQGDFTYTGALDFGKTVGLVDYANCDASNFLRDHVAAMSLTALATDVKGEEDTKLLEKLVADGAVAADTAADTLAFFENYDAYMTASAAMADTTAMDLSVALDAKISLNGQMVAVVSMPMEIQANVDTAHMDQTKMAISANMQMEADPALTGGAQASINMPVKYYYTDGVYYMNMGDEKVKMEMSLEDAIAQMGGLDDMMQQSEPLCLIDSITRAGNRITVTYSASGMSGLVDTVLDSMNMDELLAGIGMEFDDIDASVTVVNNRLESMDMSAAVTVTAEGQTVQMTMDMTYEVNATGNSVRVQLPNDLNTYVDMMAEGSSETQTPAA